MVQTQLDPRPAEPADVLITGATGFVGLHVAAACARHYTSVRALVRATSRTDRLRQLGVVTRLAPLDDPHALRSAVEGAEVVIHLAALTHARTEAELTRVNVGGTQALVHAMLAASPRPRRLVYMSSLAAAGPGTRPVGRADQPRPLTAYGRTKLAGERVALEAAGQLEVVVLRPPAVYGPGDAELLRFFRMAKKGWLPVPAGPVRPLQLVYVHDLARAVLQAAATPAALGLYHVADAAAHPWAEVCRLLGRAAGRSVRLVPVPAALIGAAAAVSEWAAAALGRSAMFNRDKARELLAPGWLCDTEDARRELAFVAGTSLEQGLVETWQWYRNEGWV